MFQNLTYKQKKVFDFYKEYITENKISPTYTEVWMALWISPSVVFFHVNALEKMWYVRRASNGTVSLTINSAKRVPIFGKIACGAPIQVSEYMEDEIEVPDSMLKSWDAGYALKARGSSMEKAGIFDGDLLIIKHQNTINDWEIGVAVISDWFEEVATLKQIFIKPDYIVLQPKNEVFPPIYAKNCEIRGKLVGVIRNFW